MAQQNKGVRVRAYRASIALSNMGINMLQRYCYDDATATLRDALDMIRLVAEDDAEKHQRLQSEDKIQQSLNEASGRFARALSSSKTDADGSRCNLNYMVTGDDFASKVVDDAVTSAAHHQAVVVRMDEWKMLDVDSAYLDAAIILLNFGCARLHCSAAEAYQSFRMSFAVLSKVSAESAYTLVGNMEQAMQVNVLSMLVVQHLMILSHRMSLRKENKEYVGYLLQLKQMYQKMKKYPVMLTSRSAPAA